MQKGPTKSPIMESHQQMLAQAVRYVAGSLGHELNNHLTVIVGMLGLAKRQAPQASKALERMEQAVEGVYAKTQGLTTLAQELGGARQPVHLRVALESALSTITEMGFPTTANLGALDGPNPIQVRMDPTMLPLALYFAIHPFADKGTHLPSVNASLLPENEVGITISGAPLDMDLDLVEQTSSTNPAVILGQDARALGISTVKAFAQRCQGRLEVALESHEGSAITIILPLNRRPTSFKDPEGQA